MIISHKYRFIFIKTKKVAGTSLEAYLSEVCGDEDVFTPVTPPVAGHRPRNYRGRWNPLSEVLEKRGRGIRYTARQMLRGVKFYNHIPASVVRTRVPAQVWDNYYKFTIERNPWDKVLSHYYMYLSRNNCSVSLGEYLREIEGWRSCYNYPLYHDTKGRLLVDQVLSYESLNAELAALFSKLGVPFSGELGVKAKAGYRPKNSDYNGVYSEADRDFVAEAFADEISLHGYSY